MVSGWHACLWPSRCEGNVPQRPAPWVIDRYIMSLLQAKSAERVPLLVVGERGSPGAPEAVEADVYDAPPEDTASWCSRALFCWNVRLMRKGMGPG